MADKGFMPTIKGSLFVLLFEFFGTMWLVIFQRMLGGSFTFIYAYWILIGFGLRISGAHYNPAITIAFMLKNKKMGNFSRWLGLAYIIAQFIGGLCGGLLALLFTRTGGNLQIEAGKYTFQAMCIEALGSFLFVFVFLV